MRTWGWGGADEIVGTVVGEAPLDEPWAVPLSNGRIPCYRGKLSAQWSEKPLHNDRKLNTMSEITQTQKASPAGSSVESFWDNRWRKIDPFVVPSVTSSSHHSRRLFS